MVHVQLSWLDSKEACAYRHTATQAQDKALAQAQLQ